MKIYFDPVEETASVVEAAPAARPRRRLRNWHKFVLCYAPMMIGGAILLYQLGGPLTMMVGLLIWSITMLIILTWAWRHGRL